MKVVFDPEALVEVREAAAFYESAKAGLGRGFLDALDRAVSLIRYHPLMYRRIKGRFRRYLLRRFPYAVIYTVDEDVIYVAAVMHLKRKPGYWLTRMDETS